MDLQPGARNPLQTSTISGQASGRTFRAPDLRIVHRLPREDFN
jgi:hypothetical protein